MLSLFSHIFLPKIIELSHYKTISKSKSNNLLTISIFKKQLINLILKFGNGFI